MRRFMKSFATICPVSLTLRRWRTLPSTAAANGPPRLALAQLAHFLGGTTGVSRSGFFDWVSMRHHRGRNLSTFFVILVTAFSPTHATGM